ncbi:MAG: B12-binding domain-containing radical SAM protein, partial [Candidatus Omnitrophica bacterium]|nr:B12-binding domain-containing radical SAM protein [Candidatus Omnitrophota bacterium]
MIANIALFSFLDNSINTRLLSSYLKKNGYEVTCFFCEGSLNRCNSRELIRILKEKKIDFAGVSLVTDNFLSAVTLTKIIKEDLHIPVIWGGAHVNVMPEECLRYADMICLGEGEEALLEVANSISQNKHNTEIKNIWFKDRGNIIRNELRSLEENLDKYPFPDFDFDTQYFMNSEDFSQRSRQKKTLEYSLMTSRGCPYRCSYCYNSYRWKNYAGKGKYVRTRSIENVIEELVSAKQYFGKIERVNIWDDSFLVRDIDNLLKFKELYVRKINIPFFIMAEPMAFNEEKIKILKNSGLSEIQMGIQSGSERVNRDVYNRPISNEKILDISRVIHQLGIRVKYDIIFNNPYENKDDLLETIGLLRRFPKPFFLQGYNLIFYPGTEITETALKDQYIS